MSFVSRRSPRWSTVHCVVWSAGPEPSRAHSGPSETSSVDIPQRHLSAIHTACPFRVCLTSSPVVFPRVPSTNDLDFLTPISQRPRSCAAPDKVVVLVVGCFFEIFWMRTNLNSKDAQYKMIEGSKPRDHDRPCGYGHVVASSCSYLRFGVSCVD